MKGKMDKESFFADPKVAISIFALLVSMASLFWTLMNQWDQNKRWDAINLGDLDLKDIRITGWKSVSDEEFKTTNWGYTAAFYPIMENSVASGRLMIPFNLILVKKGTKSRIDGSNYFFTVDEGYKEIKRLNLDPNETLFMKNIQFDFSLVNSGKTQIHLETINIKAQIRSGGHFDSTPEMKYELDMKPGATVGGNINFMIDFNGNLPEISNYLIEAQYEKNITVPESKVFRVCYSYSKNVFQPGNIEF
jgi:hypothetical protein